MIVLDASVVIAFLNPTDLHHSRATQLIEEHSTGDFRMHQITLAEVLVDAVRTGRGVQLFDDLMSLGVVTH
jgi:predicted nucleic acid-binding protein